MGTAGTHSVRAAEFGHIEDASVAKPEAGCGAGSSPPSKLVAPRSTRADPAMSAPARSLPHLLPLWKRISVNLPVAAKTRLGAALRFFDFERAARGFSLLENVPRPRADYSRVFKCRSAPRRDGATAPSWEEPPFDRLTALPPASLRDGEPSECAQGRELVERQSRTLSQVEGQSLKSELCATRLWLWMTSIYKKLRSLTYAAALRRKPGASIRRRGPARPTAQLLLALCLRSLELGEKSLSANAVDLIQPEDCSRSSRYVSHQETLLCQPFQRPVSVLNAAADRLTHQTPARDSFKVVSRWGLRRK